MKPSQALHGVLLTMLIAAAANAQSGSNHVTNTKKKELAMTNTQNNKVVVQKMYEQALNHRDFDLLKELVADEYTGFQGAKGAAAFRLPIKPLLESFPDIQWKVEEMVAEGDKVTVRFSTQGTHTAPFNGLPPTGNKISGTGIAFFALKDGKIVSGLVQTDRLGFLQELGVLPHDVNEIYARKIKEVVQ